MDTDQYRDLVARHLLRASPLPIISCDLGGLVTSWNPAAERLLGWSAAEVLGQPLPSTRPTMQHEFGGLCDLVSVASMDIQGKKKDGSWVDLSCTSAPILDDQGQIIGVMVVYVDITERKQLERALIHHALHDPLTGLPNRTLLLERVEQALRRSRRTSESVAFLLMDLDHFKEVNDTHGHQVGDQLLQEIAHRLHRLMRTSDTAARLSGDEFAILLPDTSTAGAQIVAGKILDALREPWESEGDLVETAASIGITVTPDHGHEISHLFRRADTAMYAAKREGSGIVTFNEELELRP